MYMAKMDHLPFLSEEDFSMACEELVARCRRTQGLPFDVALRKDGEQVYFTTVQQIPERKVLLGTQVPLMKAEVRADTPSDNEIVEEIDEDDEMAFHHSEIPSQTIKAGYSILLSPTYRVPVLYVSLYGVPPNGLKGIHAAYHYLVPKSSQQELSTIGVMGGLSMTNHPVTDIPCYFLHPCKTAEAMEELIGSRKISQIEYLQLWIGLIGGLVGLYLPKELAIGNYI